MRNITITVEEEVALWAKVHAAKNDTSVSRMLGEVLKEKMETDREYDRAMGQFFGRRPVVLKSKGSRYASREAIHER